MAAVTGHRDFGAQENKSVSFHSFPIYLSWSDGTRCHDPSFWMMSFTGQLLWSVHDDNISHEWRHMLATTLNISCVQSMCLSLFAHDILILGIVVFFFFFFFSFYSWIHWIWERINVLIKMTQMKNRAGIWFCVLNGPVFASHRVPDDLKPVIFWGLPWWPSG